MFEFLSKRLDQVKARRVAAAEQTLRREETLEAIKRVIPMVKDLLRDARYQEYATLLRDARTSCLAERESLLRAEGDCDPQERDLRVALLTGRIQQLDYILDTPESFLALADQGQRMTGNGRPAVPDTAARSPARESGLVAAS